MKRFLLIAMIALLTPAAALAKGASEATIEGPGLDGAVVIPGDGEGGGGTTLGPRYVVRYVMPGPEGQKSILVQHLYPYAKPYPVSYTKPGQPFWGATSQDAAVRRDGQHTFGGWYVSTAELRQTLAQIGLPTRPPSADDGGFWSSTPNLIGVIAGIAAALLAVGLVIRHTGKRRPQPA